MEFRPGALWGRYEIVHRVAVGGMAEVYRARLQGPAGFLKELALKRMRPEFSGEPGFRRMFQNEAIIAARLNHPNIIQTFEFIEQGPELALSMEFVSGISLRKLLAEEQRRGIRTSSPKLSAWTAAYVALCASRALCHAWEVCDESGVPLRLIHRDVSPDNLLLSLDGGVKLIDFGIARSFGEVSDPGTIKGKLLYMSPEQVLGGTLDARSDLYSLGIVLYESALGMRRPLFDAESESLTRVALLKRHVIPPSRLDPDFPESLSFLIMKALERDPDRRFESAAALVDALENLLASHWRGRPFESELSGLVRSSHQALRFRKREMPEQRKTYHPSCSSTLRPNCVSAVSAQVERGQTHLSFQGFSDVRRVPEPVVTKQRSQRKGRSTSCDRVRSWRSKVAPEASNPKGQHSLAEVHVGQQEVKKPLVGIQPPRHLRVVRRARGNFHRPKQEWIQPARPEAMGVSERPMSLPRASLVRFSELCLDNVPYFVALLILLFTFWSLSASIGQQAIESIATCGHHDCPPQLALAQGRSDAGFPEFMKPFEIQPSSAFQESLSLDRVCLEPPSMEVSSDNHIESPEQGSIAPTHLRQL